MDKGTDARFTRERETCVYMKASDETWLLVTSVGTARIDDKHAVVRVTPPGGKPKVVKVTLGPPNSQTSTDQGDVHILKLLNFRTTFPPADPAAKIEDYVIEAYLEQDVGGDFWTGKIVEV